MFLLPDLYDDNARARDLLKNFFGSLCIINNNNYNIILEIILCIMTLYYEKNNFSLVLSYTILLFIMQFYKVGLHLINLS